MPVHVVVLLCVWLGRQFRFEQNGKVCKNKNKNADVSSTVSPEASRQDVVKETDSPAVIETERMESTAIHCKVDLLPMHYPIQGLS